MFSFAIFWRQNIGKKVMRKMLIKLTPGDVEKFFRMKLLTPEIWQLRKST